MAIIAMLQKNEKQNSNGPAKLIIGHDRQRPAMTLSGR